MRHRFIASFRALLLCGGLCVAIQADAIAQSSGIEALSQSQTLNNAQSAEITAWFDANVESLLGDDPGETVRASQDLIELFQRRQSVTAAFRIQMQDALLQKLKNELNESAPPAARFAALRLCGRIGMPKVLPTLFDAIESDNSIERSLGVAAFADFFATVGETSSPIRDSSVDGALDGLEAALSTETEPSIASQFVVVLANTDAPGTNLRLRATGAMARGLAARMSKNAPRDQVSAWAVTLSHAIENANKTFVQVALVGQQIDRGFIDSVVNLCKEAVGFIDAAESQESESGPNELLVDLRKRAEAVEQRVSS